MKIASAAKGEVRFTLLFTEKYASLSGSEGELEAGKVRSRSVGPPLPAAGRGADRRLLRGHVGRHVKALLERERRLDLLNASIVNERFGQSVLKEANFQ